MRAFVIAMRCEADAVEPHLKPTDRLYVAGIGKVNAAAAVADWRPATCSRVKLKKGEMSGVLRLVRNPDILKSLCARSAPSLRLRKIGFAAETDHVLSEAARKCREKGLSFIVANDVTQKGCGFGTDTNRVTFVFPDGTQKKFPLMTKRMVAKRILDEVSGL